MKRFTLFALLAVSGIASAGTATVSWTNPTQYTDGTALAAADITSTTVEYGTCAGSAFGTKAGQIVVNGSGTMGLVNNLTPGTWCFRAATTAKGQTSAFSNVASKVVVQPAPNPPTIIDVIIAWIKRIFGHFA